jgi:competence protein ComEC
VDRGDVLEVAGLRVEVLWPARRISRSPENNASVVVLVEVPTERSVLRVLLTGDIEAEAQRAVMARTGGSVDVVKIPHHGSRYQGEGFASWAGAGIAVVSAGAGNDHGHPSEDTLERYREAGAIIGRTDTQGALAVVGTPRGPGLIVQR